MYLYMLTGPSEFNRLKEKANFMAHEVMPGIFKVEKDRFDFAIDEFISVNEVIRALNDMEKVIIVSSNYEYRSNSSFQYMFENLYSKNK